MKPWDRLPHEWGSGENILLEPPPPEEQLEADWRTVRGSEPDEVHKLSKEDLRQFVQDVLNGTVFLSVQVRQQSDIPMVFLPIALGAFTGWPEEKLRDIGVFFARMSHAMPRSINGNPIFDEVRVIHKDDWARASIVLSREWARWKDLEV